jgi:hypothetical protein
MFLDPRTPIDDVQRIGAELRDIRDRIDRLAAATGTEAYQSVAKLQALVEDIQAQLDEYLSNDAYTKAQVDARITNPALVGNVSTSGSARFNGGLASTDVYGRLLTYGGPYTATWCHSDGTLGTVPSSRRFKQDFRAHGLDLGALDRAEVVAFRYKAAVENKGEKAEWTLGGLAEQFVEAGLGHAVVLDDEGEPFSIEDRPLLYTLLAGYQRQNERIAELEASVAELKRGK